MEPSSNDTHGHSRPFKCDFVGASLEAGYKSKHASWDMGTWVQRLIAL